MGSFVNVIGCLSQDLDIMLAQHSYCDASFFESNMKIFFVFIEHFINVFCQYGCCRTLSLHNHLRLDNCPVAKFAWFKFLKFDVHETKKCQNDIMSHNVTTIPSMIEYQKLLTSTRTKSTIAKIFWWTQLYSQLGEIMYSLNSKTQIVFRSPDASYRLTHLGQVTHILVTNWGKLWFRERPGAKPLSVPMMDYYQFECENKNQVNKNKKNNKLYTGKWIWKAVCQIVSILSGSYVTH